LIEVIGGGEYALGVVQIRGGEKAPSAEKRHACEQAENLTLLAVPVTQF
jgi:hypothetical protein